jgi:hypothetical protein
MQPIRSRPGDPLREPPRVSSLASTLGEGTTSVAAAALVVTDAGIFDRPDIRLIPIIAIDLMNTNSAKARKG